MAFHAYILRSFSTGPFYLAHHSVRFDSCFIL